MWVRKGSAGPTSNPDCLDYLTTGQEWPRLRSVVKLVGRRGAETRGQGATPFTSPVAPIVAPIVP